MGGLVCFQQYAQSIEYFSFSHNLSNKGKKIKSKKSNEQPWTLAYTLVLQALSSPLKKNSFVQTNKFFPPK
jgi:hypothetical protein